MIADADPRIAQVNIEPGETPDIAILESKDIMALTIAVAIAISNGRVDFLSGTNTTATLQIKPAKAAVNSLPMPSPVGNTAL